MAEGKLVKSQTLMFLRFPFKYISSDFKSNETLSLLMQKSLTGRLFILLTKTKRISVIVIFALTKIDWFSCKFLQVFDIESVS